MNTNSRYLYIPVGDDNHASIPLGLNDEDYSRVIESLELWKNRIVSQPTPDELKLREIFLGA